LRTHRCLPSPACIHHQVSSSLITFIQKQKYTTYLHLRLQPDVSTFPDLLSSLIKCPLALTFAHFQYHTPWAPLPMTSNEPHDTCTYPVVQKHLPKGAEPLKHSRRIPTCPAASMIIIICSSRSPLHVPRALQAEPLGTDQLQQQQ
jgi:hypothetical protein